VLSIILSMVSQMWWTVF